MPYYNKDPKRDPNIDNHPYVKNPIKNQGAPVLCVSSVAGALQSVERLMLRSRMSARSLSLAWQLSTCYGNADPCWFGVPDDVRDLCCTFGNSSCFTNEFTFERCCPGVQASSISATDHVQPHIAQDRRSPCFEEGYSFTYGQCCESADDGFKILISDGGCFDSDGPYTYLKCCLDLPDLQDWIHVDDVKGSPTSDFFEMSGTLYMTEPAKQQFREGGSTMPRAKLGGVSHADVESPCLKSFLYDSRFQLLQMWSGKDIFPPPIKNINGVIKFRTRIDEAVACWGDAECQLYMVKLDWYSMQHHRFEGAYVLTLPVTCSIGEAAVTVIPIVADRSIRGPALILGGASFQRVRGGDACVSPPRTPGVLAMCGTVCALSLAPFLYCRFWRHTSSASASKEKTPNVAVDVLRLLATWIVVDTHRRQPFPFKWPICHTTGADIARLEDVFVVLTVRLMSMHSLTLQSFAMRIVRKVAVQASTQIAVTHVASLFVRPASPWYCGQKLFFEEQPHATFKGWLEWMLGAATMRNFATAESNNFDSGAVWPVFPADDFPNPAWPTSTWFVCLEYSIVWFVGAAIAIESVLPHVVPAGTVAYFAWMCVDVDHQPHLCVSSDHYQSLRYCRLPSAMLTHCACRALERILGTKGSLRQRWTPLVIAAIGGALALSAVVEDHPAWEFFGFGKQHCRRHLPYMVAGLPFQFALVVFTFLDIQLPAAAAVWVSYLANLNFCVIVSHHWMLVFFEKHAPEFTSAWASVKDVVEGNLFATQQLVIIFGAAAFLHALVAQPVQLLVREAGRYPSLAPPLASAHLALCLLTWPRNFSYYPLFTYGDSLPGAGSSQQ